jgi:hypothetical protein
MHYLRWGGNRDKKDLTPLPPFPAREGGRRSKFLHFFRGFSEGGKVTVIARRNVPVIARRNVPVIARKNVLVIARKNVPVIARRNVPVIARKNVPVIARKNDEAISFPRNRSE